MTHEIELSDLESIKELGVPIIDADRNYWLVRSNAGKYFEDFTINGYIGISWNKIDQHSFFEMPMESLRDKVKEFYPEEKVPGNIAGQILRFANDIKVGDIVLIPSANSKYIAFCEVLSSDIYFVEENEDDFLAVLDETYDDPEASLLEPCLIRKPISVIRTFKRTQLDPYIYPLMNSHHTITNAELYSHNIDRMLHSFYVKKNKAHFVLHVNRKDDIPAQQLISALNHILNTVDLYNELTGFNFDKNDIEIKLNVQSPGPIELYADTIKNLVGWGLLITALLGGKHHFKLPFFEHTFETKGIIERVLEVIKSIRKDTTIDLTNTQKDQIQKCADELDKVTKPLMIRNESSEVPPVADAKEVNY